MEESNISNMDALVYGSYAYIHKMHTKNIKIY